MKIRERADLLLINLISLILVLIIVFTPSSVFRVIIGIPFVLFFPGYAAISALYPTKTRIKSTERLLLSFSLSIAIVPIILLLLNFTKWGIKLNSILYSVSAFTLIVSIIALFRWHLNQGNERFSIKYHLSKPPFRYSWKGSTAHRLISVFLIFTVLGAIGLLYFVVETPTIEENYTEFYILSESGKATGYPQTVKSGEAFSVIVGIKNHEDASVRYRVEIFVDEAKETELKPINLYDEETWEDEVTLTPAKVATNQKVEFLLYKDGGTEPYMNPLHFWLDVTE